MMGGTAASTVAKAVNTAAITIAFPFASMATTNPAKQRTAKVTPAQTLTTKRSLLFNSLVASLFAEPVTLRRSRIPGRRNPVAPW